MTNINLPLMKGNVLSFSSMRKTSFLLLEKEISPFHEKVGKFSLSFPEWDKPLFYPEEIETRSFLSRMRRNTLFSFPNRKNLTPVFERWENVFLLHRERGKKWSFPFLDENLVPVFDFEFSHYISYQALAWAPEAKLTHLNGPIWRRKNWTKYWNK